MQPPLPPSISKTTMQHSFLHWKYIGRLLYRSPLFNSPAQPPSFGHLPRQVFIPKVLRPLFPQSRPLFHWSSVKAQATVPRLLAAHVTTMSINEYTVSIYILSGSNLSWFICLLFSTILHFVVQSLLPPTLSQTFPFVPSPPTHIWYIS